MARSVSEIVDQACTTLLGAKHRLADVMVHPAPGPIPNAAGLYAIYGSAETWKLLGLSDPTHEAPLYVGKAEVSLVTRDLETHFRSGRTGQSTLRRSFAALLRQTLKLQAVPRNPLKPERFAHFALEDKHDRLLTTWMLDRLEIAPWEKPPDCANLGTVEVEVMRRLSPALNIKDHVSKWRSEVVDARKSMAADARAWAAKHSASS